MLRDPRALSIYCADVGSISGGRFGWAHADNPSPPTQRHAGSGDIELLVDAISDDLIGGVPVSLGFECPLFVPVPEDSARLGKARNGDGSRAWSANAGAAALATGLVQTGWILERLQRRAPSTRVSLDWRTFTCQGGLFLWEAFVTGGAKADTHIGDAALAVDYFVASLPDPDAHNAVTEPRALSLIGACALWSGLTDDRALLRTPCLVLKVTAPTTIPEIRS